MMSMVHDAMEIVTIPFAVGSIGLYASNAWEKAPNRIRLTAIAVAVATITSILGATWLPHVIAAISIGVWVSLIWRRWSNRHQQLLLLMLTVVLMTVLGAGWVLFPIGFVTLGYLMSTGSLADPGRLLRKWNGTGTDPQPIPAAHHYGVPRRCGNSFGWSGTAWTERHADAEPQSAPQPVLATLAADPRLPQECRDKAQQIQHNSERTLSYLQASGGEATKSVFTVEQIRDDYAPTALRAYLALPEETATTRVIVDGKTGADLLGEQLDTLLRVLGQLRDEAADHTATQLLAHQQFLQNRFGGSDNDLEL